MQVFEKVQVRHYGGHELQVEESTKKNPSAQKVQMLADEHSVQALTIHCIQLLELSRKYP